MLSNIDRYGLQSLLVALESNDQNVPSRKTRTRAESDTITQSMKMRLVERNRSICMLAMHQRASGTAPEVAIWLV